MCIRDSTNARDILELVTRPLRRNNALKTLHDEQSLIPETWANRRQWD